MKPVLLSLAIMLVAPAAALTYTYQFTGTIDTITKNPNNAIPGVFIGQTFSGWFSYNDDSKTSEIGAVSFTLGSFQPATLDDRLYPVVNNATVPPEVDFFQGMYYDEQGQYDFWRTGFYLEDTTCTAFSSTQLPTDLALSMFTSTRFNISGNKDADTFYISGPLTSLSLIPEPATLLLLSLGGLMIQKRR